MYSAFISTISYNIIHVQSVEQYTQNRQHINMNISTVNISSFPSPMLPDIPLHQEISDNEMIDGLIFAFGIMGGLLIITLLYAICKEVLCFNRE